MIDWWVKNPVAANLLMLGILLAGVLGFGQINKEAFPQINMPQVQVSVTWNGASAEEIEDQVVVRIEDALEKVPDVESVYAVAMEGSAALYIDTHTGIDLNAFTNDVKNAVDSITALPRDIENPLIKRTEYREELVRVAVVGDIDEKVLAQLGRDLRDDLAARPYISNVDLYAAREEEVSITLSEARLRQFKLTFDDVSQAIRRSSMNISTGQLRTATGDVQLRSQNMAEDELDFAKIIIRQTEAGGKITLADVADIDDGLEERDLFARVNGKRAVLLSVESSDNVQIVKVSESVQEWIEETNKALPDAVEVVLWFDEAEVYTSRMGLLGESAFLGLLLVFGILAITLHPTVALWVAAGIGVAYIGTFAVLPAAGISLNVISTFGLLLVLGIVVDDAIIVGESVHRATEYGLSGEDAAVEGTRTVARPVFFAVITTIVAFLPWAFTTGVDASMDRVMALVIAVALTVSLIEAFWILPSHLRKLEPPSQTGRFAQWRDRVSRRVAAFAEDSFRPRLERCLNARYTTTAAFLAIGWVGYNLYTIGWVGQSFFPEIPSEEVGVELTLPTGTPLNRSLEILQYVNEAQSKLVESFKEETDAPVVKSWYTRLDGTEILAVTNLASPEVRDISTEAVAKRLEDIIGYIPDAQSFDVTWEIGQSQASSMTFDISGRDEVALAAASKDLQRHLSSYQSVTFVRDNQEGTLPELRIKLKKGTERLGIQLDDVARQVRQAYYGEEVQRLPRDSGDVKVMLRYPQSDRAALSSLDNFRIRTEDGRPIPLTSVATLDLAQSSKRFQRIDGERTLTVIADADSEAIWGIWDKVENDFIPALLARYPTVNLGPGGAQAAEEAFFEEIGGLYLVAFFAVYALVAVAFKSYTMPLLVMSAIPFAFIGALYGHLLFGVKFGMFSWFGVGAAAGVVLNDNLVLLDVALKQRRAGRALRDALISAAVTRFRPIALTTTTTFVGLMPILLERSTQAQFLKPAVISLSFGVVAALFVSLLMVPAVYLITDDVRTLLKDVRARLSQQLA